MVVTPANSTATLSHRIPYQGNIKFRVVSGEQVAVVLLPVFAHRIVDAVLNAKVLLDFHLPVRVQVPNLLDGKGIGNRPGVAQYTHEAYPGHAAVIMQQIVDNLPDDCFEEWMTSYTNDVPLLVFATLEPGEVIMHSPMHVFAAGPVVPVGKDVPVIGLQHLVKRACNSAFNVDVYTALRINQQIAEKVSACCTVGRVNALIQLKHGRAVGFADKSFDIRIFIQAVIPARIQLPDMMDIGLDSFGQRFPGTVSLVNDPGYVWPPRNRR